MNNKIENTIFIFGLVSSPRFVGGINVEIRLWDLRCTPPNFSLRIYSSLELRVQLSCVKSYFVFLEKLVKNGKKLNFWADPQPKICWRENRRATTLGP
jgi:hypothetical protein